jgi:glutathione S-transferase
MTSPVIVYGLARSVYTRIVRLVLEEKRAAYDLQEVDSLADFHAYPMLKYLSLTPEGAAALARHEKFRVWLNQMEQRPSAQRTLTQYERE